MVYLTYNVCRILRMWVPRSAVAESYEVRAQNCRICSFVFYSLVPRSASFLGHRNCHRASYMYLESCTGQRVER